MQISYTVSRLCKLSQETVAPGGTAGDVSNQGSYATHLYRTVRMGFGKGG